MPLTNTCTAATRVPDEILSKVFIDVVLQDFNNSDLNPCLISHAPWNVASTCGRWRRVCLSNPRLWTHITTRLHACELRRKNRNGGYESAAVLRTYTQLERSGNLPIHVDAIQVNRCNCDRTTSSMLRVLAMECKRWKSFRIELAGSIADEFRLLLPSLPKLTQLESLTWGQNYRNSQFICPFKDLTQLRSLTLPRCIGSKDKDLPWSQLLSLCLDDFSTPNFDNLFHILSQCSNLAHLRFSLADDVLENLSEAIVAEHEPNSIILQNLSSLDISNASGGINGVAGILLSYLRLPNLRILACENPDSAASHALVDFIKRSSCSITTLDISFKFRKGYGVYFIQQLPLLESLTLRQEITPLAPRYVCNIPLRRLVIEEELPTICPSLRHVEIVGLEFDPVLLVQAVESRKNGSSVAPMQSLTITPSKRSESQTEFYKTIIEERLRKEKENGLEIRWR